MSVRGSKYTDGEYVLCYQGLLIYEAKIQGVRKEGTIIQYDVHYKGWNKTWDEWVTDDRLLKVTPENLKKQKEVEEELKKAKTCASKKSGASAPLPKKKVSESSSGGENAKSDKTPAAPGGEKRKQDNASADAKKQKVASAPPKELELVMKGQKPRSRSNSDASIVSTKSTASSKHEDSTKPKQKPEDPSKPKKLEDPSSKSKQAKNKKPSPPTSDSEKKTEVKEKPKKTIKKTEAIKPVLAPAKKVIFGECVTVDIPENLKNLLVDDYDFMIRQRKLTTIPSRYTVADLINAYNQSKQGGKVKGSKLANIQETCRGMKDYFNATLGCQLLYKFERIQYADVIKANPEVPLVDLYGPVHLLRLITKLGPMLTAADIDKDDLNVLVEHVTDFVEYISRHKETLFVVEDYGTASPEYHRRAL